MLPFLAVTVGLLVQSAGNPHPARATRAPAPDPVRVWRTDSTVYVALRQPGHLLVLHVDAIGRIQVLFPLAPDDSTAMSDDAPVALALPPTGEGNPATFVAVRSRWPFEFPAPAPQPVYVPYYLPIVVHGARRFPDRQFPPPAPPAPRSMGVAFPIAPRLVVPSSAELRTYTGRRH